MSTQTPILNGKASILEDSIHPEPNPMVQQGRNWESHAAESTKLVIIVSSYCFLEHSARSLGRCVVAPWREDNRASPVSSCFTSAPRPVEELAKENAVGVRVVIQILRCGAAPETPSHA